MLCITSWLRVIQKIQTLNEKREFRVSYVKEREVIFSLLLASKISSSKIKSAILESVLEKMF